MGYKAKWGAPRKKWNKAPHKERCYLCHPWKRRGRKWPRPQEIRAGLLEREGRFGDCASLPQGGDWPRRVA